MIRLYFFILLLFPLFLFSQNKNECSYYKYGKFTFPLNPDGSGYAVRQNNIQTSFIRDGEKLLVWSVMWNDDCHYRMVLKEIYDDSGLWTIGDIIDVEINSFKNNCYGYKANVKMKNEDIYVGPTEFYDMMCKEEDI